MRDLLTALAGAVILILVAALAAPPLIDWQGHRALVDRAVSRSLGVAARSEGRIEVRFLPSPRLRLDRLRLGDDSAKTGLDKPAIDIRFVKAEIALAPLLKGEVRFTETRIGRAEIKLPVTEGEALLLPPGLAESLRGRDLAIEDLHIQQFLLTTLVPATGRTDQFYADGLRLQAPALTGPWRVEGASGGLPFRLASGEPAADGSVLVKLSGGGDTHPRFEADARIGLVPSEAGAEPRPGSRPLTLEAEGSARLVVGPPTQAAGAYLPLAIGGKFKGRGPQLRFEDVGVEVDPGGQALRLTGSGRIDLRQWRAGLSLGARRLDLDAFLASSAGRALIARGLPTAGAGLPVMLDLDLAVESATLGLEDWSNLAVSGTFDRSGGLLLRRLAALAPGEANLTASGQLDADPVLRFTGPVSIAAPASDGLGRYLRRLGIEGPVVALMDGRPIEAAADISAAPPALSVRNLRLVLGSGQVTGNARYTVGDARARGRFEAQIRAQGIDIAALPSFGGALAGLSDHDIGVTFEARGMRYGTTGSAGTIAASVQSDGASLVVDSLDVTDLAGANAKLSGRINPDGAGRITGRLWAPVAAPLIALLDRVWVPETRFIPGFLRTDALDLSVMVERDAGASEALRSTAGGKAGGGTLDLSLTTRAGRVERADVTLTTARAGLWFGRADIPGLQRSADLRLTASRAAATEPNLALQARGTLAGLKVSTPASVLLGAEGEPPAAGTIRAETADLGPFLTLAGAAGLAPGAWPADLTLGLSRAGDDLRADLSGRVAGAALTGRLIRGPDGGLGGSATLARLSLPQLAAALVAPAGSAQRSDPTLPTRAPIALDLRVETLDLGRSLTATGTTLKLGLDDGSLTLRDLAGTLAEGRLSGSATLSRRNSALSISGEGRLLDASIPALADGSPITGRLSADLRFSAAGDGPAALAANLAGSGTVTLKDLALPEVDPGALPRALSRALDADDPLREGRLKALVGEELSRAGAQAREAVTSPATIVGGVLRAAPIDLDLGAARWSGSLGYDVRSGRLDARGTLTGGRAPKGWTGAPPTIQLGLGGTLAEPERSFDVGALTNGLSAVVLQRELEKIELFEADQIERQRRRARIEMDKARAAALKAAAEKAAADKAAAEEAARQARLKAQQAAEEEARRTRAETVDPPPPSNGTEQPLDIRPPAAQP